MKIRVGSHTPRGLQPGEFKELRSSRRALESLRPGGLAACCPWLLALRLLFALALLRFALANALAPALALALALAPWKAPQQALGA